MITFNESTMERSRWTAIESLCSSWPYSASATSPGSAGRGSTQRRPSPTWGGITKCGPTAVGLAASVVSGVPTGGAGGGVVVSAAGAGAGGRPKPPLGPLPRLVPPKGGSSARRGGSGGMMVMRDWWRSIRHAVVSASVMSSPCSTMLAAQVSRVLARGSRRGLNSGQHLSQPLRRLDQPRRRDREGDAEEPFAAGTERAPREGHHACLLERPALERRRGEPLRQRHPDVHRSTGSLGFEPLRPQHGHHRVPPLPELRHVAARQRDRK